MNPVIWPTVTAVGFFFIFWAIAAWRIGDGPFLLDPQDALEGDGVPGNRQGRTFEPFLDRYRYIHVSKTIIGLGVASVALLSGYVSYVFTQKRGALVLVQHVLTWPIILLAFSVLFFVLFMALLTFCYDNYLQEPESYTRFWYSLVTALGFAGLASFAGGYLFLAYFILTIS